MTETVPPWKFWHPVAFWKVLVIFAVLQIACTFAVVALREGAGLSMPGWIEYLGSGLGGALAVVVVSNLARRARARVAPGRG